MKERDGALKPYQHSAILVSAAVLLEERLDAFARVIAQEGGKPLTDARIEAIRAVDGLRNAAEEIRNFTGREIPMAHAGERWPLSPPGSRSALSPRSRPSTVRST